MSLQGDCWAKLLPQDKQKKHHDFTMSSPWSLDIQILQIPGE